MLKNHQQETPEDHLEDSGSHLSTCESRIGCLPHPSHTSTQTQVAWTPVSPLGVPLHHVGTWQMLTKCRQMSTNVHKCPGVSKQPGRTKRSSKCLGQMSAVIGQDYQFWVATAMINDWNHRLVLKTSDMWTTGQETWHRTHPNAQDKSVAPVSAILTMKRCSTSSSWRAAAGQDGGQVRKTTMHLNKLSRYVMLWTLVTIPIVFICIGDWLILQMHLG